MGLFGFGENRAAREQAAKMEAEKQNQIEREQQELQKAKPPGRLSTEGSFVPSLESEKSPHTIEADVAAYGKLVQSEGGPIVRGFEHAFVGSSKKMPKDLVAFIHQLITKDGGDISNNQYPWPKEGVILKASRVIEGRRQTNHLLPRPRNALPCIGGHAGRLPRLHCAV